MTDENVSSIKMAGSIAKYVYEAWKPFSENAAAKNAFALFCSLMRLDDSEIEHDENRVSLRARARNGICIEASGKTAGEALNRLVGRL